MADTDLQDDFAKSLAEEFAEEAGVSTPPAPAEEPKKPEEPTPPATSPAPETPPAPAPAPGEEPKKDDKPAEPPKEEPKPEGQPGTPPAGDEKKPEDGSKAPEAPETPPTSEAPATPQPLSKDDVTNIIRDIRVEERTSAQALDNAKKDVMEAYYPDGLSRTLVDETTGKKLETPQDVVDASGGQMSIEEAAQWLTNEQFKLDKSVSQIEDQAQQIAETTINFKRDSIMALQKYDPLFQAYPALQRKAFDLLMKQVKADESKGVILQAPDVMDLYDTYLEPYQKAFEFSNGQPATNPNPPAPATPAPSAEDRLDEPGNGGASPVNDPNDFAQQVVKELDKGM